MHRQIKNEKVFLTGERGIGKSTVLNKVIQNINCSLGGFIQDKELNGDKTIFKVISLYNPFKTYIIGIYHIKKAFLYKDINAFNMISREILDKSFNSRKLIILDELGFMEEDSECFKKSVFKILDSNTPVLGVLKECDSNFVRTIKNRNDVQVIKIDKMNRDTIHEEIIKLLIE